ncbi:hypothetical protein [Bifidobacterium saguinibicoloris]|uniref:hypothetical protein n=1 Tax=Bifidobacterium saguinibicoloris TaxID=2834433 RepID=UPI001C571C81|nr:hypothetical protein [Bifidobacterium saguinibicoloris]MBW3081121.1 hypothetical protein [Bifidobacterium saguinibicoloris]
MATENNGDAEYRLSVIAQTPEWTMPTEVTQYVQAVSDVSQSLFDITDRLNEKGVFECQAKRQAQEYCENIIAAIRNVDIDGQVLQIKEKINSYNAAIHAAQNVSLPGDALDEESQQVIMGATQPLDCVVPGLGKITGIAGIAGVNMINRLLATNRNDVAAQELDKVQEIADKKKFKGSSIPIVDPPAPKPPLPWPDPHDDENHGGGSSSQSIGSLIGGGAAIAGGAGAVALSRAAGVSGGVASAVSGGAVGTAGAGAAVGYVSAHPVPAPPSAGTGSSNGGTNGSSSSPNGGGAGSNGSGRTEYGDYVYDPVTHKWVRKDDDSVAVDSSQSGLHGGTGFGKIAGAAGVGAGVGVGGALAAGRLSGSAGGAGLSGAAAGMGVSGGGVGLAAVGGAGGVGSYYANTPVHATIASSSSLKGATGMASGLQSANTAGASAASGAGARTGAPGMMGGQGGAGNGKKQKRRGLGYIAPVLEDDEEFEAKPLAAMAGRRKRSDEM